MAKKSINLSKKTEKNAKKWKKIGYKPFKNVKKSKNWKKCIFSKTPQKGGLRGPGAEFTFFIDFIDFCKKYEKSTKTKKRKKREKSIKMRFNRKDTGNFPPKNGKKRQKRVFYPYKMKSPIQVASSLFLRFLSKNAKNDEKTMFF